MYKWIKNVMYSEAEDGWMDGLQLLLFIEIWPLPCPVSQSGHVTWPGCPVHFQTPQSLSGLKGVSPEATQGVPEVGAQMDSAIDPSLVVSWPICLRNHDVTARKTASYQEAHPSGRRESGEGLLISWQKYPPAKHLMQRLVLFRC